MISLLSHPLKTIDWLKRGWLICLGLLCVFVESQAQSIHFENSYQETLRIALKKDLPIFIDFYTQWCRPCKMMEKDVFTAPEVGKYFNEHLVSVKIDAETPEGRQLAKQYQVTAYPTFVFLDSKGDFVKKAVGAQSIPKFLDLAQSHADSLTLQAQAMRELFEQNKLDKAGLMEYIVLLRKLKLPTDKPFKQWMNMLTDEELYSQQTFDEISAQEWEVDDYAFGFLLDNYNRWKQLVGGEKINAYLYHICIFHCYKNKRMPDIIQTFLNKLEEKRIPFCAALKENFELVVNVLKNPLLELEFIERAEKLVEEHPECSIYIANEALKQLKNDTFPLEEFMERLLEEIAQTDPMRASSLAVSTATQYYLNVRNLEKANMWVAKYLEWSGDPDFSKGLTTSIRRGLGLIPCANYGKLMPDFNLPDINGKTITLNQFKGKYVLLDFWASWCGPCKKETLYLKRIYPMFKDRNIVFVSVSADTKESDWKRAVEREELEWIQVVDLESVVCEQYNITRLPRIMLIDPDGRLCADDMEGEKAELILNRFVEK